MAANVRKSRSIEARDAMLRPGAGTHGDRRTKRLRDRGAQKRAAIRGASE